MEFANQQKKVGISTLFHTYQIMLISVIVYLVVIPTLARGAGLEQLEHIIIFMQENRPFDHYFGTLSGVRGFNDRATVPLKSGLNVFYQAVNSSETEYMLPYRVDSNKTNAMCMEAPQMYYPTDIEIYNSGRMDAWNTARDPGYGMSYFTRADLPYYYTLYDNFLCGDQYFQSTFTCTNPNRMMLFSGSNGLSVGEEAVLENIEPRPGYNWTTMAEILEENKISWKVYQQVDNFDDNAFAWFNSFQRAQPGSALYDKGMKRYPNAIKEFEKDLQENSLPQVSWIIAPTEKSEHATNHPAAGEDWTAQLLKALQNAPNVYAKSAFILNYDEGGQFFDHSWSPTPPVSPEAGISTVSTDGEINTDVLTSKPAPIGLGFRVPLLIVSPWTRGNLVLSQVMDHTSIIKLIERKFNVECPNISPWRRAITGDLTAAFDFDSPDYSWPVFPDTSDYVEEARVDCLTLPDPTIPEIQSMPVQEQGVRYSRALTYEFFVIDTVNMKTLDLTIQNNGIEGAPFVLFDVLNIEIVDPRQYAIEGSKSISSDLSVLASDGSYSFHLQGPNGFVRNFQGNTLASECTGASSFISYEPSLAKIEVNLLNYGEQDLIFTVKDNAYDNFVTSTFELKPNSKSVVPIIVEASGNWYDLTVFVSSSETSCYERRSMGRMETGKDGISDPAMANAVQGLWGFRTKHPKVDSKLRKLRRTRQISKSDTSVHDAKNLNKLYQKDSL